MKCVCVGGDRVVDERVKVKGHLLVTEEEEKKKKPAVLAAVNAPSNCFLISCGKTN